MRGGAWPWLFQWLVYSWARTSAAPGRIGAHPHTPCILRQISRCVAVALQHPHTIRHGFGMVYLMQDFAWKNFDLNAEKIFLDTFQDRIPLRYQNMICVSAREWPAPRSH